jgi:hypothetical protein
MLSHIPHPDPLPAHAHVIYDGPFQDVLEVSDAELLQAEHHNTTISSQSVGVNYQHRQATSFCPSLVNCNVTFNMYGASAGPHF